MKLFHSMRRRVQAGALRNGPRHVRIIQLTEAWGGMEHNNTQLAHRLARLGHRVTVSTLGVRAYSQMPDIYRDSFVLEEVPWASQRVPTFAQWCKFFFARPADVVVLPKNWWAKGGLPLVWASALCYPRVVLREHVAVPVLPRPSLQSVPLLGDISPQLWWIKHVLYGRLLSLPAKHILCVSDTVRTRLIEQCAFPSQRTVTVHNGIDTSLFRRDDAAGMQFRDAHGISRDAIVLGSVGRLDNAAKRHDWSVRAFAQLVARHGSDHSFRLVLVGDGADRQVILALAEELGVSHLFTILPQTNEPWAAYNALDVFLMPSAFEAFGLALAEAMACERCCVAVGVDGIVEVLADPETGLVANNDEMSSFCAAVETSIVRGVSFRRATGEKARESVVRRFNADTQYARIAGYVLGDVSVGEG